MLYLVQNPNTRTKAVKLSDGFVILHSGEQRELDANWTNDELGRYRAAGLVISPKRGRPRKQEYDE